ncbi:MAG: hypothetical protein ACHP7D_11745 [Lysobacterales bacterium]
MLSRCAIAMLIGVLPGLAHATDRKDAELELAQAATAVQGAQSADAQTYAVAEMDTARAMLAAAQDAFDRGAWTDSAMNAEKAKVDGDLAAARSRQQRAAAATAEIEASVRDLRARIGVREGDTP